MPSVSIKGLASRRGLLALGISVGVVAATVGTAAAQAAPHNAAATANGPTKNVIVVLRDQHTNLSITRGSGNSSSARVKAFHADQSPVVSRAKSSGAKNLHGFSSVNAISATVTQSQATQLATDPSVAAIYPDLPIKAAPIEVQAPAATASGSSKPVVQTGPVCPSNPGLPILEPEALQVTNTAFENPNTPQAQSIVDGTGVKVAYIADGIDINNPDFIRADGSHVFVDYQDFSGDGLAAVSGAAEAFGDASSIAAQGLHSYDLSNFVNQAHPLPPGCNITVRGMAPGASLIGLKVFGNSNQAPTSRFIEAIDYAVSHGADVLNESFGGNPYPDNGDDPISLADQAAVAAGVTVVSSTGDAGVTGTIGTPSDTPGIIGVGGTTIFRSYLQTTSSGIQLSGGKFVSNNISGLSSGGITQFGTVPDLVAPGDLGWALCTPDLSLYAECTSDRSPATPSPIQQFGGTSQSSPLTAGAAALVIEAYENTHGGAKPAPALVKRLLTSTATDLGHPAYEQGSGLLNSLAAVKAAQSWEDSNGPAKAVGNALVVDKTQLTAIANPSTSVGQTLTITNDGTQSETVNASTRALTHVVKTITGSTSLDVTQAQKNGDFYIDAFGIERDFAKVTFNVPAGIDRLTMEEAMDTMPAATGAASRIILIDPNGVYTSYSIPQGAANYANTDVRFPTKGKWTAYIALSHGSGFSGPIQWAVQLANYATHGTVSPSSFTLAPRTSRTVTVHTTTPSQPSDLSASVQFTSNRGVNMSVPLTIRSVVPPRATTFTGNITGGNGRAFFGPAQTNDYFIQVPSGKSDLSIGVTLGLSHPPNTTDLTGFVQAILEGPNGQVYALDSNFNDGNIQLHHLNPQPGTWVLTIEALNPVQGDQINTPFTAKVSYNAVKVSASLPQSAKTKIAKGSTVTVPVTIKNNGAATLNYYVDPRLSQTGTIQLQALDPKTNTIALPQTVTPQWWVPSQSTQFTLNVNADQPVNEDVFFNSGEPDHYSAANGNGASVNFIASEVSPGIFASDIGQTGPFTAPAPAGTATFSATATGKLFDLDATSDTADLQTSSAVSQSASAARANAIARSIAAHGLASGNVRITSSDPRPSVSTAAVVTPEGGLLTLAPGQTGVITVTISPTSPKGAVVNGHLYVDTLDFFANGGDELIDLPYTYTVG